MTGEAAPRADDGFEASFVLGLDRATAWRHLTEHALEPAASGAAHCWLPGFDAAATVTAEEPGARLAARKDDDPAPAPPSSSPSPTRRAAPASRSSSRASATGWPSGGG